MRTSRFWLAPLIVVAAAVPAVLGAEIEQRYVTTWNPSPVARFSLDETLEVTSVRCRLKQGDDWGDWWNGRQITWEKGPQVWHLPLKHLAPGSYDVQHDLRTPLGADWREGVLRVPQIARFAGQPIQLDGDLSDWPQSRYGAIPPDGDTVWFAWDVDKLYIAQLGDPLRDRTVLLAPLPGAPLLERLPLSSHSREAAVAWSELAPAGPHLGQVLSVSIQGTEVMTVDLLFVGGGLDIYFGTTWVSGDPGHDDQGPPPPVLRSVEDRIPGINCRSTGINWGSVEKEDPGDGPSNYDWRAIPRMRNLGYDGLVYCGIDTWCDWAEKIKESEPERYRLLRDRFLRECTQRLRQWGVEYYSLGWNEPELFHFTDREAKFLEDLNATVDPLRAADPQAQVIAGKFSGGDPGNIRSFVRAGFRDNFDVLDIHPYANDPRTGCAMGGVVSAHEVLEELGMGHKRLFLGEGWGPTRNLPQVVRARHDAPVSEAEADFMRQYYWNGYRCLTQPRPDYNPEWVLGAKFFTLNDNVGMTYWRVSARPHYNAKGEIDYYLLSHLAFGSLDDMNPEFWNGGLVDFYGQPKGPWLYDFPPSLPDVRLRAETDAKFLLRDRPVPIRVVVTNAEREPITALALGVRHRTETFREGTIHSRLPRPLPEEAEGTTSIEALVEARVEGGPQGPVRLAVELDYTWRGTRYCADAILRTELRDDTGVTLEPERVVLARDAETARATVTLANNTDQAQEGPLFRAVPEGVAVASEPAQVNLAGGESGTYAVSVDLSGAPAGLHTLDLAWGLEQGLIVQRPLVSKRFAEPPAIDADLSDWPQRDPMRETILFSGAQGFDTLALAVPFPVPTPQGADRGKGTVPAAPVAREQERVEARAVTGWDETFFYLAAVVDDDTWYQPYDQLDIWKADSLQVAFDPLRNGPAGRVATVADARTQSYQESYNDDDFELGLALTPNGPQAAMIWAKGGERIGLIEGAKVAVAVKGKHMVYEAALPWAALAPIRPGDGASFAMDLLVNESDGKDRYTAGWADAIAAGKYPSRYVPVYLLAD